MQDIYLLITRHLAFQTNADEDEELKEWIAASRENELLFQQLKTIWLSERRNSTEDHAAAASFAELKARLQETAEIPEIPVIGRRNRWLLLAAASVIVIVIGVAGLLKGTHKKNDVYLDITAAPGEIKQLNLPDGSLVTLAPGSRLSYPERFGTGNRNVRLQGQAFFKVSKNEHQPFVVITGKVLTEVLGTSFNVTAFDVQEKISVALVEGKVSVKDSAGLFQNILQPGKEWLYDKKTQAISVQDIDPNENVEAWTDRQLYFNNIPLAVAAAQIQAVYGKRLVFTDSAAARCRIWGKFKSESLVNILETIKMAGNIRYTIKDSTTVLISKIK